MRSPDSPHPPGARSALVSGLAALLALIGFVFALPARAAVREPVLLISGFDAQRTSLDAFASWLRSEGDTVYTMQLPGSPPGTAAIKEAAAVVASAVTRIRGATGASRVDIVAHSEGGLAGRYYVKYLHGLDRVATFIDVGTPNYGVVVAVLCAVIWQGCADMVPDSAFLNELNAGDPTPGTIPYFHLFSDNGNEEKVSLPGATNASVQSFCPGRAVEHAKELDDMAMRRLISSALHGGPLTTACS
ncbi:alpha/beta hydrolase [Actinoallomurus sp. NPDC050550]|uniref:esterase/lipase family protein n=1 Tax=Actinoallomurus sp. NPDC050550 TaxID=3154937 RepID=UPI0033C6BE2E